MLWVWLLRNSSTACRTVASPVPTICAASRPAWKAGEKPGQPAAMRQSILTHDVTRYEDELFWRNERPQLRLGAPSWGWVERAAESMRRTARADVLALAPDAIQHAVATSCRAKAAIVAEDETEGGVRALLNLGHTFGHAVEAANQYRPDVLHGEAVALGMVLAFRYGAAEGITSPDAAAKVARVISASGLPVELGTVPGGPYEATKLADLMKQDKKARGGRVPLILARGIGQSYIHSDADLNSVAAFLAGQLEKA